MGDPQNYTIHTLEDKYVPQKEVSSNRKGNFPLNANTRKLIRRKNRLWTRYMETDQGWDKISGILQK